VERSGLTESSIILAAGHELRMNCLGQTHGLHVKAGIMDSELEDFGSPHSHGVAECSLYLNIS
jgi:hypothetical protein